MVVLVFDCPIRGGCVPWSFCFSTGDNLLNVRFYKRHWITSDVSRLPLSPSLVPHIMGSFSSEKDEKHDHGVAVSTKEIDTGAALLAGGTSVQLDAAEGKRIRYASLLLFLQWFILITAVHKAKDRHAYLAFDVWYVRSCLLPHLRPRQPIYILY